MNSLSESFRGESLSMSSMSFFLRRSAVYHHCSGPLCPEPDLGSGEPLPFMGELLLPLSSCFICLSAPRALTTFAIYTEISAHQGLNSHSTARLYLLLSPLLDTLASPSVPESAEGQAASICVSVALFKSLALPPPLNCQYLVLFFPS